jgi:serine/threonine protein kinase
MEVWAARAADGTPGIVKTIRPELRGDRAIRRSLIEDLSVAIHLHHPGVARIIEFGSTFVAAEPPRGPTLRAILERARKRGLPVPPSFSLGVIGAVARSLQHTHLLTDETGAPLEFLHRGIRPEVITVSARGRVVLHDLGLARATALAPAAWADGKLAYLAPEQARGAAIDSRADLYGLALCLYEALSGVQPCRGGSDREVLRRVVAGRHPPLRTVAPSLSATLDSELSRALATSPTDRHPTLGAFADALASACEADAGGRALGSVIEELFPDEPIEEHEGETISQELTPARLAAAPASAAAKERASRRASVPRGSPEQNKSAAVDEPSRRRSLTPVLAIGGDENARAARACFERSLELLLEGRNEAALEECELALALLPSHQLYRATVARLRQTTGEPRQLALGTAVHRGR